MSDSWALNSLFATYKSGVFPHMTVYFVFKTEYTFCIGYACFADWCTEYLSNKYNSNSVVIKT